VRSKELGVRSKTTKTQNLKLKSQNWHWKAAGRNS